MTNDEQNDAIEELGRKILAVCPENGEWLTVLGALARVSASFISSHDDPRLAGQGYSTLLESCMTSMMAHKRKSMS